MEVGTSVGAIVGVGVKVGAALAFVGVGIGFFVGVAVILSPATSPLSSGEDKLLGSGLGRVETESVFGVSGTSEVIKKIEPVTVKTSANINPPVKYLFFIGYFYTLPKFLSILHKKVKEACNYQ